MPVLVAPPEPDLPAYDRALKGPPAVGAIASTHHEKVTALHLDR